MTSDMPYKDGTYQDPWNEGEQPASTGHMPAPLIIEEIKDVEPLDDQFGVHPPKTVPDALYAALLGPVGAVGGGEVAEGSTAPQRHAMALYAILDAAKITNLPELLATSGLEHRCLFKGQAEDDLKNVAPWIVKLEEGKSFTRHLFTHDPANDVPWYLWDKDPGIYIRSTATLHDLWKHFRKFTRLKNEEGQWFYFRFWEPDFMYTYMQISQITTGLFNRHINSFVMINRLNDGIVFKCNTFTKFSNQISTDERELIKAATVESVDRKCAKIYKFDYAERFADIHVRDIAAKVSHARVMCHFMGIDDGILPGHFIMLGVIYMPEFWRLDEFQAYWQTKKDKPNEAFQDYLDILKIMAGRRDIGLIPWW